MTIGIILGLLGLWLVASLGRVRERHRVAVLEALSGGPRVGRDLPLRISLRYVVLHRMESAGLVESMPVGDDGQRVYQLTQRGQAAWQVALARRLVRREMP